MWTSLNFLGRKGNSIKNGTVHSCMCCKGVSFYCGFLFWRQHCLSEISGPQSLWEVPTLVDTPPGSLGPRFLVPTPMSVLVAVLRVPCQTLGVAPPCSAHHHYSLLRVYGRDYRATKNHMAGLILVCPCGSALQEGSV